VTEPALYVGRLRHRRFRPREHAFTYRLFMALVDIDRVADQMSVSPFTSVNRFNWASFDDRDHLGDPRLPLRERLAEEAARTGHQLPDGRILLLTHLRYLGYNFNPISFFYCFDRSDRLGLVVAEVHNTFGGQCLYWLPPPAAHTSFQLRTPKTMHVSPFMSMDVDYEFAVTPPAASLVAHMNTIERSDGTDKPYFDATLTLERRPWSAREIHRVLLRHPWMTATVIGAIHWEAFRLWLKGVPSYPNPDRNAGRRPSSKKANGQEIPI